MDSIVKGDGEASGELERRETAFIKHYITRDVHPGFGLSAENQTENQDFRF